MHPTSCDLTGSGLGLGYGVEVDAGGFPYIQGNVFDNNRHAIAGSGKTGDGYTAIGNLLLNPGLNKDRDGLEVIYNHQIDMHGTDNCGDEKHDCGQGGLYQEVENNTVVGNTISAVEGFSDAAAIQLRGRPSNVDATSSNPVSGLIPGFGMYVHDNTFNGSEVNNLTTADTKPADFFGLIHGAGNVFVPSTGMVSFANGFYRPYSQGPTCDFDGDGSTDPFRDSAGTFWYYSSRLGRWTYLATDNVANDGLTFGDLNGDGLCDVSNASGAVYLSSPLQFGSFPLNATVPNLSGQTQDAATDAIAAAGLTLDTVTKIASLSPAGTVIGQSLAADTSAQAGSLITLTVSAGGTAQAPMPGNSTAVINIPAWAGGGALAFAVDSSGRLNYNNSALTNNTFSTWTAFTDNPGALTSVAAAIDNSGVIQLFALDPLGQIYHRRGFMGGNPSWSAWAMMDGNLNSIAVAANANGAVQIFGTQANGNVFTRAQTSPGVDTWTGWTQMGSGIYKVVADTHTNGEIEVDGIIPGASYILHTRQAAPNSTTFTAWSGALWGFTITDIAVGATVNGFSFYGTSDDGNVYQNSEATLDGYNTGGWIRIGSNIRNISAAFNGPNTQLIGVRADGTTAADTIDGGVMGGNEPWSATITGATIRAINGIAPVVNAVTPANATVKITWTDGSTNEDNFVVFQVTRTGATISEITDQTSPNKPGMGEQVSFTDTHPASTDPTQQCYRAGSYDMAGSFFAFSDTVCAA